MSTPGSVSAVNVNEFIHSLGSNNIVSEPRWFMILKCLNDSALGSTMDPHCNSVAVTRS